MNDFTKEELNMMADGIVLIKRQCKMPDYVRKKLDFLDDKLTSLVNNYCNHDFQYNQHEQAHCLKCGKNE